MEDRRGGGRSLGSDWSLRQVLLVADESVVTAHFRPDHRMSWSLKPDSRVWEKIGRSVSGNFLRSLTVNLIQACGCRFGRMRRDGHHTR